jgi:GMP synthase (glutamine-hydrolysing)
MTTPKILVVDLGSQYALLIARALRELGFRSAVLSPAKAKIWLVTNNPQSIILSGGDKSVTDKGAPTPPDEVFGCMVPILGICYGMQYIAHRYGGALTSAVEHKEAGQVPSRFTYDLSQGELFTGLEVEQTVLCSHGDSVQQMPSGFTRIAVSADGNETVHAMCCRPKGLWGVQFHPEVQETPNGKQILRNFVSGICHCEPDWKPENLAGQIVDRTAAELGDRKAILGFSGGVDSTTLARLLKDLGTRVHGVCIDAGQLREGEIEEIRANARHAGSWLTIVKARQRFASALATTTDAEVKRRIFKRQYRKVLLEEARRLKAEVIIQGSLATDFIESGVGGGAVIKSHHNVGAFPGLEEVHPLRDLFKYEVRAIARALQLPDAVCERKPFPGPGLFVRILAAPVTPSRLALLRWADHQVRLVLERLGCPDICDQLVVALECTRTVGVKGDARVYAPSILVRGVKTVDFMTACGVHLPDHVEDAINHALTAHPGIARVWYDSTDKPPGTTEFE